MTTISEVRWIELKANRDSRGTLTSMESSLEIPFELKRVFYMHHMTQPRGGHCHKDTDQVVIAASGSFYMTLSDGYCAKTFILNDPDRGLFVPKMLFISIERFTSDAVCLVLASTHYDMSRSFRSWEEFKKAVQHNGGPTYQSENPTFQLGQHVT